MSADLNRKDAKNAKNEAKIDNLCDLCVFAVKFEPIFNQPHLTGRPSKNGTTIIGIGAGLCLRNQLFF